MQQELLPKAANEHGNLPRIGHFASEKYALFQLLLVKDLKHYV